MIVDSIISPLFNAFKEPNDKIGDEHNGIYKSDSNFFKQFFHNECIGYVSTFFDGKCGEL